MSEKSERMERKVLIRENDLSGKEKTPEEVEKENQSLMSAFEEAPQPTQVNQAKLDALKAKLNKKQQEEVEVPTVVAKRTVSINLGIIGVGQAGSRIAETFHKLGYDAGVINTSSQDLEFIDVLPSQKLLLSGTLGGTGKSLELGREIFASHQEEIRDFAEAIVEGNDMVYLAISGGGGSGSSSPETMIPLLFSFGIPVGVIFVLPKATEDAQSKKNSIETLAKLAKMTSEDMISSLVVVDNARIEQIYGGLSQSQFWKTANAAIVEPINLFNTLTAQPSAFTSLDPSDFGKIISCGDCSVYGMVPVQDYMEETALAEAVISSLNSNMLAEGFDLAQTRVGGVIIVGSKETLDKLPAINIDYAFSMISEQTNGSGIFQGIYAQEGMEDEVRIYSWFAGLGLPVDRIENLKKESKAQMAILAEKEKMRTSSMSLSLEEDKVMSVKDEIQKKIQSKKSGFNKLQGGSRESIIDKRRR